MNKDQQNLQRVVSFIQQHGNASDKFAVVDLIAYIDKLQVENAKLREKTLGKVQSLIDELKSDINRPEGRWGMHGHHAVDDDYFTALDYCINKLEVLIA